MAEENDEFYILNQNEARAWSDLCEGLGKRLRSMEARRVFVACSGGLDSTLLARALGSISAVDLGYELHVAHVNYGLRGQESIDDAAFVSQLAEKLAAKFHCFTVMPSEQGHEGQSLQEWARELRYQWFASLMTRHDDILVLGHHKDDHAETVLMRLLRGYSLGSLMGMRGLRERHWRPFLGLRRSELESLAQSLEIPFRVDSSNAQSLYCRNRLRLDILPQLREMFPGVEDHLISLAKDAQEMRDFALLGSETRASHFSFDRSSSIPRVVTRQRLFEYIRQKGYTGHLSRKQLDILVLALENSENMVLELSGTVRVIVNCGQARLNWKEGSCSARWRQYQRALTAVSSPERLEQGANFVLCEDLVDMRGIADNRAQESSRWDEE